MGGGGGGNFKCMTFTETIADSSVLPFEPQHVRHFGKTVGS